MLILYHLYYFHAPLCHWLWLVEGEREFVRIFWGVLVAQLWLATFGILKIGIYLPKELNLSNNWHSVHISHFPKHLKSILITLCQMYGPCARHLNVRVVARSVRLKIPIHFDIKFQFQINGATCDLFFLCELPFLSKAQKQCDSY